MLFNTIYNYFNFFKNKELFEYWKKHGFIDEIHYLNYNRSRYINYFAFVLVSFLIYSDFFLTELWDDKSVIIFRITDITFYTIIILVFIFNHYKPPYKGANKLLIIHKIGCYLFIISVVIWSAIISASTETNTDTTFYTYLVCVFIAATAIYMNGLTTLIFLIITYVLFVSILNSLGTDFKSIFTNYMSLVGLIIVAWIISRILYNNKKKSFIANKELETAKNNLDRKVKERTQEI